MRSQGYADFNHDPWVGEYDRDVSDESDPIRDGYTELLEWVAEQCAPREGDKERRHIVELGSGTGNLTSRLPKEASIICVDVSTQMLAQARAKMGDADTVSYICEDILTFAHGDFPLVDTIVSTYALHHLTPTERARVFGAMSARLKPGGQFIIGDLMFESGAARRQAISDFRELGRADLAEDIEDEYFWTLEEDLPVLESLGFEIKIKQISSLSWAFVAADQQGRTAT